MPPWLAVLLRCLTCLPGCLTPGLAATEPFRVGFAETDITPPAGYRMYGSLYESFATGTNDPLRAKAMVLAQGSNRVALAVADLAFVSRRLSDPARDRAAAITGIPRDRILLLATHTHAGPEYDGVQRDLRHRRALRETGRDDHEPFDLLERYVASIGDLVGAAARDVRPATIDRLRTRPERLAFNRRYHLKDGSVVFNPGKRNPDIVEPAGPVDPDLSWLLFRDASDSSPLGSLTTFALHVATFASNATWGADYPGVLAARLRARFEPEPTGPTTGSRPAFVSIFAQGTAGDINHIDVASDAPQPADREFHRLGNALADSLLTALPQARRLAEPRLAYRSATVTAPLVKVTPERILRARDLLERTDRPGGIAFLLTVEAWQVLNTEALRNRFGDRLPLEINVLAFDDDTALVCLPHEVFVRLGLLIKDRSPFRHTLVVTMAHDLDFYVLDRQGYAEGGYEAVTSSLEPGAGELMVATAVELLRALYAELTGRAAPGRSYE